MGTREIPRSRCSLGMTILDGIVRCRPKGPALHGRGQKRTGKSACATGAGSKGEVGEVGEGGDSLLAVLADFDDAAVPRSSGQKLRAQEPFGHCAL